MSNKTTKQKKSRNIVISHLSSFSFDKLSSTQFEKFCYDLLTEMGFINVRWRKGTGKSTSPADRGRDIECERLIEDIDGSKDIQSWFVECKHHKRGVPPEKINSALSWANAKKPDVLLIIASNFLSNGSHDLIKESNRNNPTLKIKVWERPDLERLTVDKSQLLKKYNISGDFPFVPIIHPAHLLYIKNIQLNSLGYFIKVLEQIDKRKRERILSWVYEIIIKPRYRESITGEETIEELRIDEVSYEIFKERLYILAEIVGEPFLVFSMISWITQASFSIGNYVEVDKKIHEFESYVQWLQNIKKSYLGETDKYSRELEIYLEGAQKIDSKENTEERINKGIEIFQERIRDLPDDVKRNYSDYVYFCENVIKEMLLENFI